MSPVRRTLWNALVCVLIPFTLGAGLPQMHCRCAAAKGQRWSECCFRPQSAPPVRDENHKSCCRHALAKTQRESSAVSQAAICCMTCASSAIRSTGTCCELKAGDATTLSPAFEAAIGFAASGWLTIERPDWQVAACSRRNDWPRDTGPPLNRVIAFGHLLI